MADPTWWERKIHPDSSPTEKRPKMFAVSVVVGGTVEIQFNPKMAAHRVSDGTSCT